MTDDAPTLWRALAACPDQSRRWAGLGYRVGVVDGAQVVLARLGQAGQQVAAAARDVVRREPMDVITARRQPDHRPCPARCRRCSRCVHAEAWHRRGGRPYLGVEAEARLAAGAA